MVAKCVNFEISVILSFLGSGEAYKICLSIYLFFVKQKMSRKPTGMRIVKLEERIYQLPRRSRKNIQNGES